MPRIHFFGDKQSFYQAATDQIAAQLLDCFHAGDNPSLLLSGGSTPGPIYKKLSKLDLPWRDINIGLVDERWVNANDNGSNAQLISQTFLQNQAVAAPFTPMKTRHSTTHEAQSAVESKYSKLVSANSIAILGMGTDGHVCSWFPDADGLLEATDPKNSHVVQAITAKPSDVTGVYLDRMTLTFSALNRCGSVILLTTGAAKKQVLKSVLDGQDLNLPVARLLDLEAHKFTILHAP